MTSVIYQYRFHCIEEDIDVTAWGETAPTLCPNNHADRTIDTNSITVIETRKPTAVTAQENSNGYFETNMFVNNVPSGATGTVSTFDVEFDSDVTLWRTVLSCGSNMIGDEIKVVASPETIVGQVTSPVSIGDTVINVNSTVTANVYRGCELVLDNTVNKHVTIVTAINAVAGTITIKNSSPYAFAATSLVKLGVFVVKYAKIHDTNPIDIGLKGIKGKELTKGVVLRIYYTNNDGQAKTIHWRSEYYNNG